MRRTFRGWTRSSRPASSGIPDENSARAPGFTDVDASACKNIPIHDAMYLQFRAEMFNVANHANFGVPVADLASPNFGHILQSGSPRLVQFAAKIIF